MLDCGAWRLLPKQQAEGSASLRNHAFIDFAAGSQGATATQAGLHPLDSYWACQRVPIAVSSMTSSSQRSGIASVCSQCKSQQILLQSFRQSHQQQQAMHHAPPTLYLQSSPPETMRSVTGLQSAFSTVLLCAFQVTVLLLGPACSALMVMSVPLQ